MFGCYNLTNSLTTSRLSAGLLKHNYWLVDSDNFSSEQQRSLVVIVRLPASTGSPDERLTNYPNIGVVGARLGIILYNYKYMCVILK